MDSARWACPGQASLVWNARFLVFLWYLVGIKGKNDSRFYMSCKALHHVLPRFGPYSREASSLGLHLAQKKPRWDFCSVFGVHVTQPICSSAFGGISRSSSGHSILWNPSFFSPVIQWMISWEEKNGNDPEFYVQQSPQPWALPTNCTHSHIVSQIYSMHTHSHWTHTLSHTLFSEHCLHTHCYAHTLV